MWTPDPSYWIQGSDSVDSRFQMVCFSVFQVPRARFWALESKIPDSKFRIPDSKEQYSGFYKQMFFWIPESGSPYMGQNING